jgi:hypothetical protein
MRVGFNLECGKLESYLVSKNGKTASPKNSNGKLEFSLENGFLIPGMSIDSTLWLLLFGMLVEKSFLY